MTLYTRQQKRHRYKEQTLGLCGRRWRWNDLREQHWNTYIIICKIDRQTGCDAWGRVLRAGALGQLWGMGWGGRWEGGSGWGTHVHPWLIHVNVWQKPPQYCKVIQFSSVAQSCLTLWDPMNHSTPGLPVYHQLPEFTQTHVHWVSDAIQPSHPLSSPSPALNLSQHHGLFKWVRWPKYWSFSFNISPSRDHPGLISFRMDWLDLLAVQGTLKSLLQHHSSKASILQRSAFFTVQL